MKEELPGVFTSLGVSNISFGLAPGSRKILNSVFLHEAVAAGLDMAIIDAGKIVPMSKIPEADREVCLDLIYNRPRADGEPPLSAFLRRFADASPAGEKPSDRGDRPPLAPEEELAEKVLSGDPEGLEDLLPILLSRRPASSIINQLLVPAMRRVGGLFGVEAEIGVEFVRSQGAAVFDQFGDLI